MIVKVEAQENAAGMLRDRNVFCRVGDNLYYIVDGTLFLLDAESVVWRYEEPINTISIQALRKLNSATNCCEANGLDI